VCRSLAAARTCIVLEGHRRNADAPSSDPTFRILCYRSNFFHGRNLSILLTGENLFTVHF